LSELSVELVPAKDDYLARQRDGEMAQDPPRRFECQAMVRLGNRAIAVLFRDCVRQPSLFGAISALCKEAQERELMPAKYQDDCGAECHQNRQREQQAAVCLAGRRVHDLNAERS
jgi:hypothetical protein